MELRHLRYFVAVAAAGSVSKAAGQIRISQPALSRQIHDLERELGVALFERAGRRLHLTGSGEDLLAYGQKVLNEAEAFRERARVLHRGDTGVLHVGATPQSLERLFPAVLHRFRRILPGVDVRLTEGPTATLLDLIRRSAVHLVFMVYQPELRAGCKMVGMMPLLAVSEGNQRMHRDGIEVRELENKPLLLLNQGFGARNLFDAACHVAHIRPNIFLESSAPSTLVALAKAGSGVAILPGTVSLPRSGLVIQKLVQDGAPVEYPLAVHWNPQRFFPTYAQRFVEVLSELAAKEYVYIARHLEVNPDGRRHPGKRLRS